MSKYDKMIEENRKKSQEKVELARRGIYELLEERERITVPKLVRITGLSRGFFYKNAAVREEVDKAIEQQAGMVDPRKEILNLALEKQIGLLQQQVRELKLENEEWKKKCEKLQKTLKKQDLSKLKKM